MCFVCILKWRCFQNCYVLYVLWNLKNIFFKYAVIVARRKNIYWGITLRALLLFKTIFFLKIMFYIFLYSFCFVLLKKKNALFCVFIVFFFKYFFVDLIFKYFACFFFLLQFYNFLCVRFCIYFVFYVFLNNCIIMIFYVFLLLLILF